MVRAQPFSGLENENPCHHTNLRKCVCAHLKHDTGNSKVEIVSFLSHREGKIMVHICHKKYEWGLG
jgi:hypothetical protein